MSSEGNFTLHFAYFVNVKRNCEIQISESDMCHLQQSESLNFMHTLSEFDHHYFDHVLINRLD